MRACSLAALVALGAAPAAAQQSPPGTRPAAVYNSPFPTTIGQPGTGFARPVVGAQQPVTAQPPATRALGDQPLRSNATGRPDTGPPPGYRSVGGTGGGQPAPQPSATPQPASPQPVAASAAGQVMYYHKPADALAVDGMADPGALAQAPPVSPVPVPVPDIPVGLPRIAPPPAAERPLALTPAAPLRLTSPVVQEAQPAPQPPMPDIKPMTQLPPEVTQLPPRDKIFGLMYDDARLERAIVEKAMRDKNVQPGADGSWKFPAPTPVVAPGTPHVQRTGTNPPMRATYEPGFVVHRRLHFEEKNSERYGWNLGIAQPFISAGYFYKDLLLYPMKLASNVHERYDTNAGKAMAGSPVPYLHYPPELTFGGMVIGSTAIIGTVFLLP